jgi:uncharacterized protein (TIGR02246 family)
LHSQSLKADSQLRGNDFHLPRFFEQRQKYFSQLYAALDPPAQAVLGCGVKHLIFRPGSVAILIMALVSATSAADRQGDEAAIRDLVQTRQQQAWNQHDAKAYAALFAEDGDLVNVVGWWWRGRKEIESKLTDAFAFVFRESTLTITEVNVRFLTSEIAVAHMRWTMSGARTPPTIPEPREGLQTFVLQKLGTNWMIAAFQNTNHVPEVPFPKQPSAQGPASQPPR